ncbi:hypothetical protein Hanom_Chr14g01322601 [Helianthus anomalus]
MINLLHFLGTVLTIPFYMTLFSTAIALILPITSFTITGPMTIKSTVETTA